MYSAERLAERYDDFGSALEVVAGRHEAEKQRQWDLRESLNRDKWQNSSALWDNELSRFDSIVAYHQHRLDVCKAICMKTLDMTQGTVVNQLPQLTAQVSPMQQMRPFPEQVAFLRWLYFTLVSSPYQKLRMHWPEFQIAHNDMESVVDILYRWRKIAQLSHHERHYGVTKTKSVRPVEELRWSRWLSGL